ncbi:MULTISPECIES: carboxymuconolactone decarboxylase family protein [unclassified Pseudofrankia]|uniref:carboxymuconolactone decarboxylase family protein n=1 Tax=unclassified Pseudofrankia TaxID=2994372 RepID=UPI0008DA10F0|nr:MULTISPECIES: carboxymuconolactone decarboxylase family protein [unclassified Pseudofrankia]MDT3439891.1 carboxymuconolactone decarboxylase family protein [Pseudofrankia sp. BMG5.37]OHV48365.1 carboxymuconolactone decarboxylase [Pseudofrankia sp. BMG5.36]
MSDSVTDQTYREVMTVDPPAASTPFEQATREFVFGQVWSRPALSRRDRRLVTLTCVAAADAPQPIDDHVYAALGSGDLTLPELLEFVLHFAVYCGWPKASHVEGVIRRQWARLQTERGEPVTPWPALDNATLGPNDWDARLERGVKEFIDVNLLPAPPPDTPYTHAGILSYVFGHLWQRPGLTRRDRRIITVACVAIDDSPMPLQTHVGSALGSGDITKPEMNEIALHFSVYYGFAKGEALQASADAGWARLQS